MVFLYCRHENCHCLIDYDPGSGKRVQDIWTKRWTQAEESDKIEERMKLEGISGTSVLAKGGAERFSRNWLRQEKKSYDIPASVLDDFDDFEPLSLTKNEKQALKSLRKLSDESDCEYGVLLKGASN